MDEVAAAYGTKYDDRDAKSREGRPFLHELAKEFKTSTVRIRKILITRGLYSTAVTREVARLSAAGHKIPEICEIMNLKSAAVIAAMPYDKGIYNIDPKTAAGIRAHKKRRRKEAVVKLAKNLEAYKDTGSQDISVCMDPLWNCIMLFQGYRFKTSGRNGKGAVSFTYQFKESKRTGELTDEIVIDRKENSKTITRSTVEVALINALNEQENCGCVRGPKKLGCFGASYLYSMFLRFGLITSEKVISENEATLPG